MVTTMNDIEKRKTPSSNQLLEELTIKFAGDSGDGIQLTAQKFAELASSAGEQVRTMPDFPAEIRSPAGTLGGVSGFQIRTGSDKVYTHGDELDVLVVMNPASLQRYSSQLKENGIIIINQDTFTEKNLEKAQYHLNPLHDGSLAAFRVFPLSITKLTMNALKGQGLSRKEMDRCKNFFAFGLICWLFPKPTEQVKTWIKTKFAKYPQLVEANLTVFDHGWNYGETEELFAINYTIKKKTAQQYQDGARFVTGNAAIALGLVKAARKAGIKLFLGGYPITPATEIMQELLRYQEEDVVVFQAEDEIAAIGTALGAAFAGSLGATSTSGPGLALMAEFVNLAVIAELPLIIIDVQRAGPSTGVPTKTEQADLLQALWGRNGESPLPVLAATTPQDCFDITIEAARIAVKYMTPVMVMSDLYLSAGADSWVEPSYNDLPEIQPNFVAEDADFAPYRRDPQTLARSWAIPGKEDTVHIIGGLEKNGEAGSVSYDPDDHEKMVKLRADKIAGIGSDIPLSEVFGDEKGQLLLVGWGSTYGAIREATEQLVEQGYKVACTQVRHINPLPDGFGDLLKRFEQVLVLENNLGQFWLKLRAQYLLDLKKLSKVQGSPFNVIEITSHVEQMLTQANTHLGEK
jgi:2-oxoglutarate/2-oxoacid ferredoxin oxidoreductase subunit alpha